MRILCCFCWATCGQKMTLLATFILVAVSRSHVGVDAFSTHIPTLMRLESSTVALSSVAVARIPTQLHSSFFGKFEEFDDDEDDDDDDDEDEDTYNDLDDRSIADFKSKMSNMFGGETTTTSTTGESSGGISSVDELINFARKAGKDMEEPLWARPTDQIRPGTILVANPNRFCESGDDQNSLNRNVFRIAMGEGSNSPNPSLLAKFGLTRPPPKSLGADRQADLLPVVVIVESDERGGVNGVLLNRRTGYLLGDLEQPPPDNPDPSSMGSADMPPILEKFCIQPLWFGGVDNISTGLDILHLCPAVQDATRLTDDGMYWGGDPAQASDAMDDPSLDRPYSGFDFKFFVQSTVWSTRDLNREIKDEVWFPANVSKDVLFKSRDRMGTKKAKPLWTEIMELMGGRYSEIKERFYAEGTGLEQDDD